MSINQNLLNALLLQYRGKALAAHAAIEELLRKPSEDGIVEDITRQTQRLIEYEALMNTLKIYFGQKADSVAPQPQPPSEEKIAEIKMKNREETPGEQLYKKYLDGAAE